MLLQILKLIHAFWEKKGLYHSIGQIACSSIIKIVDGSILLKRRVIQLKDGVPVQNLRSSLRDSVRAFPSLSLLGSSHLCHLCGLRRGFLLDFTLFNKSFAPFFVLLSFFVGWFGLYGGRKDWSWSGSCSPSMGIQQRKQIWKSFLYHYPFRHFDSLLILTHQSCS